MKISSLFALCLFPAFCLAGFVNDPQSVLIIGNSFTFYNGGVDSSLTSIYQSKGYSLFHAERVANSGWYLYQHFANSVTINKIKAGYSGKPWDVVVLQGYSNEASDAASRPAFYKAVKQLDSVVRAANSTTYLELTWSYKSVTDNKMFAALVAGYDSASSLIGRAPIIPAGHAFMSLRDTFNLYSDDKHPNESGTYLIACTFYGFLSARTPVGTSWVLNNVAAANVNIIQRKAWAADVAHPYVSTSTWNGERTTQNSGSSFSPVCLRTLGRNMFAMDAPIGTFYSITSLCGKTAKSGVLTQSSGNLDLSGFSKGMYVVKTSSYGKEIARKVVVK